MIKNDISNWVYDVKISFYIIIAFCLSNIKYIKLKINKIKKDLK